MNIKALTVLKLTVNNHPGVLSHVSGLFARRSYNLEGVIVGPSEDVASQQNYMWLLINEQERLPQLVYQIEKLFDVISVEQHDLQGSIFEQTETYFRE